MDLFQRASILNMTSQSGRWVFEYGVANTSKQRIPCEWYVMTSLLISYKHNTNNILSSNRKKNDSGINMHKHM